jgi:hypothetical protein
VGWKPIEKFEELASQLKVDFEIEADFDKVLEILLAASASTDYLEKRTEFPAPSPGYLGYLVPRTRFFFNATKCMQLRGDAVVALSVYLATQNGLVSAGAAAVRKFADTVSRLTEYEAEVASQMVHLSHGRPYDRGVDASAVIASWTGAVVSIDDILQSMEDKGVLKRSRAGVLRLVK